MKSSSNFPSFSLAYTVKLFFSYLTIIQTFTFLLFVSPVNPMTRKVHYSSVQVLSPGRQHKTENFKCVCRLSVELLYFLTVFSKSPCSHFPFYVAKGMLCLCLNYYAHSWFNEGGFWVLLCHKIGLAFVCVCLLILFRQEIKIWKYWSTI